MKDNTIQNGYVKVRQDDAIICNQLNKQVSQNIKQVFTEITNLFATQTYVKESKKKQTNKASEVKTNLGCLLKRAEKQIFQVQQGTRFCELQSKYSQFTSSV